MTSRNVALIALVVSLILSGGRTRAGDESTHEGSDNQDINVSKETPSVVFAQFDRPELFNARMDHRRQRRDRDEFTPGAGWGPDKKRGRKHLEQFRLLKLLELLDMDDEQEVEFIVNFRKHRKELGKLARKRASITKELSQKVKGDEVTERDIRKTITLLEKNDHKRNMVQEQFMEGASAYLSPVQIGKLILFQEKFELELLEAVRGFRQRSMHTPDWDCDDSMNRGRDRR